MDKKEIYEHLAKIYLDASSKGKKEKKTYPELFKNLFLVSIIVVFGLSGVLLASFFKNKIFNSEVALVLAPEAVKINFNFDPAKKEFYSLDLNNLNLNKYHALGFSIKKMNPKDSISLRVEFSNSFREKSEVYLKDLPNKWQDHTINFSEFKNINDWSKMRNLSFVVEEWNASEKKGVLYIDNVRLLK